MCVCGLIRDLAAVPDDIAGFLVERRERIPRSAGDTDQLLAIHERRPGEAPAQFFRTAPHRIHFSLQFRRQILGQISLPEIVSEQIRLPLLPSAKTKSPSTIGGIQACIPGVPLEIKCWTKTRRPGLSHALVFDLIQVEQDQKFVIVAAADREESLAHDG